MKHSSIKMCWWCFFYIIDYLIILCVGQQSTVWVKVQDGEDTSTETAPKRLQQDVGHMVCTQDASVQAKWWCQTESPNVVMASDQTWGQFCCRVWTMNVSRSCLQHPVSQMQFVWLNSEMMKMFL